MRAVSTFVVLGPRKAPLPTFPYVPIAGSANSAVSSQGTHVVLPHPERGLAGATPPYRFNGPTKSARSPPRFVSERSVPAKTVIASPDWCVRIPDHCHPPNSARTARCAFVSSGRSQTNEATNRCVRSKSDGPVSKCPWNGFQYDIPEPLLDPTSVIPPALASAISMAFENV